MERPKFEEYEKDFSHFPKHEIIVKYNRAIEEYVDFLEQQIKKLNDPPTEQEKCEQCDNNMTKVPDSDNSFCTICGSHF